MRLQRQPPPTDTFTTTIMPFCQMEESLNNWEGLQGQRNILYNSMFHTAKLTYFRI